MARCRTEDNRSRLDALMRAERPRFERMAARMLSGNAERGVEAIQEACLRVCRTRNEYQPPERGAAGGFEVWFWTVVKSVCLDWRRADGRHPEVCSFSSMPPDVAQNCFADQSAPDPYESMDFDGTVRIDGEPSDLFRFLTPEQQKILRDVYVDDNEEVDIARRDSETPGAVRSRLMAARKSLKISVVSAEVFAQIEALDYGMENGMDIGGDDRAAAG